ncbi:MAG: dihydroorotate dehydrogenase electron transfer subunit [Acidobacteriota bacterium]
MRSDHSALLLATRHFSDSVFSSTFHCPDLARQIAPGQFVMLDVPGRIRPYLRRAYSVADADPETGRVEFLVKTIGPGTAALEALAAGANVLLLGPLGNSFSAGGLARGCRVALVAGGIGAAPFPLLLRSLAAAGVETDFFLGGRTASDLSVLERFSGIVSGAVLTATNDGSAGERGFVTDLFARRAESRGYARVYACGPMPMFGALAAIVSRLDVPSEFSTEAAMGCGFGACLACVIPGADAPFLVSCQEGPVLAPSRIDWSRCL